MKNIRNYKSAFVIVHGRLAIPFFGTFAQTKEGAKRLFERLYMPNSYLDWEDAQRRVNARIVKANITIEFEQ